MMKTKIINKETSQGKEFNLPSVFSSKIREDITQKYFETSKVQQPYAPNRNAGKLHSASGKLARRRHKWKSSYGRGISRVPRKIFWRRGTQFYWAGATVVSTVGGRRAHPPKIAHFLKKKKINKKEKLIAISSAISATTSLDYIQKRYQTLSDVKIDLPLVIDSELLKLKTKEFLELLKKILNETYSVAIKQKKVRAGRGKTRGRKYKSSAGLLLIVGEKEDKKVSGIEIRKVSELGIADLYPLGRLAIYTDKAIEELTKLWEGEKK